MAKLKVGDVVQVLNDQCTRHHDLFGYRGEEFAYKYAIGVVIGTKDGVRFPIRVDIAFDDDTQGFLGDIFEEEWLNKIGEL